MKTALAYGLIPMVLMGLVVGCSGEPVPLRVSGSVVDGKDKGLDGVSVVFFPLDSKARTAMTGTSPEGAFSLDVYPGEYGMGFSRLKGGKTLQNFMSPASQKTQEYKDLIASGKSGIPPVNTLPPALLEHKTSGIKLTVTAGMKPVRFTLPVNE